MRRLAMALSGSLLIAAPVPANMQDNSGEIVAGRVERVAFSRGSSGTTLRGRIRGYELVDYLVRARSGQRMTLRFGSRGRFTYFVVRAPGSDRNLFDGSSQGEEARLTLPVSGEYRIRVFQMRNAARRGTVSIYTLNLRIGE